MTKLSLVLPEGQIETLTAKEAVRKFAAALKAQSWCIDVSTSPVKALHADSNYNAAVENFRYEFPSWARVNKARVAAAEYNGFLNNLVERLIPLLPRVVGSALKPVPERFFERNGACFANTFVPFTPTVPNKFEMPEILEEYLSRIFANAQDRKIISQWLADIVQNPARRPMWAVVLTGAQGTGKSSLFRILTAALGERHTWESNQYAPVFEKFSEVLCDHLLVSFDDAVADNNSYQKLKQAITRTQMSVEIKGVQRRVLRDVYSRILICSNSLRPLRIEEGDRRLYVAEPCQHKVSPEDTAAFFVRFNAWLDLAETPTSLYHWLMSIDLSDFTPGSTIQTEAHSRMVGLSASVLDSLLKEYVEGEPIFHSKMLLEYLAENNYKNPNLDVLKMKLVSLGYVQKRRKVTGCGETQISLWVKDDGKRTRSLTVKEEERIREVLHPTF